MSSKVCIIDTSVLCCWLGIPGKETCGSSGNEWNKGKAETLIQTEISSGSILVLPLATIIETGNHIAQSTRNRLALGNALAEIINNVANEETPWAAFIEQALLWDSGGLKKIASEWPLLALQHISIGDYTIKYVADYYSKMGNHVEIVTGDAQLKSYEPLQPTYIPRRKR
ncbi:MAG: hypothetical protein ACYCX4_00105 [Bacillota bacterium]